MFTTKPASEERKTQRPQPPTSPWTEAYRAHQMMEQPPREQKHAQFSAEPDTYALMHDALSYIYNRGY